VVEMDTTSRSGSSSLPSSRLSTAASASANTSSIACGVSRYILRFAFSGTAFKSCGNVAPQPPSWTPSPGRASSGTRYSSPFGTGSGDQVALFIVAAGSAAPLSASHGGSLLTYVDDVVKRPWLASYQTTINNTLSTHKN